MELLTWWMILSLSLFRQILSQNTCFRNGKMTCCSGYTWNKARKLCERCPPGYTGVECIFRCGFPDYGLGCYKKCECTKDMCDFIHGCKSVSKAESTEVNDNRKGQITSTSGYITKNTSNEGQIEDMTGTSPVLWFIYSKVTNTMFGNKFVNFVKILDLFLLKSIYIKNIRRRYNRKQDYWWNTDEISS